MGLFAGYDPSTVMDAAGRAEMAEAMRPWFTAHIKIWDPQTSERTAYDPLTDTGGTGTPEPLWDSGAGGALVQPLIRVTEANTGDQTLGFRQVRIQTTLPPDIHLRSGLRVTVMDGGGSPSLEDFTYVVEEGIDSSLAWGAIIICTVAL